ncbi:carbohydrate ABC transporter permease [Curtobacterium flaccumfaciens]|nr:carbohydrate ABC transporter permease [Curtobacterium flaccumfaciens]
MTATVTPPRAARRPGRPRRQPLVDPRRAGLRRLRDGVPVPVADHHVAVDERAGAVRHAGLLAGELQWQNYAQVFERLPFLSQLGTSVSVTIIRTIAQIVLCTLAGYAFARMRFRGRAALLTIVLSILLVPSQVYLISQYQIVQGLGWLDTLMGIVAPGLFSAFGTFLMRTAFLNMPPELEEAARMDGANPFQTFWRIMLPLARPSISVLAITTVLWSWNELLWPLVVSTRAEDMPLAAGLATLSSDRTIDYPVLMAASLMAMAPVLIMFVVLQRRVMDGLASSGLK